jgi:hypothetical protein
MPDPSSQSLLSKPGKNVDDYDDDINLVQNTNAWRALHAYSSLLGGATNFAATILAFWRKSYNANVWVGILFLVGSLAYFVVALMELYVPTKDLTKRFIISSLLVGYVFYTAGSAGMFPDFTDDDDAGFYSGNSQLMIWGFIFGSSFIGVSEIVDLHRLGRTTNGFLGDAANANMFGQKIGGVLGSLCYLWGTAIIDIGGIFDAAAVIWILGSSSFLVGSFFLVYRHFVLDLA